MSQSKFTLFDLRGRPRAYYAVEQGELDRPPVDPEAKATAHSVLVVDRSGSMVASMADLRDNLVKLLTLDEVSQYDLLVTLISYSGEGDVRVHFQRVPIAEVTRPGSGYQQEIRRLEVSGLTCISGGLALAESLARDGEVTAITLHSDGYANDPSPAAEAEALPRLVAALGQRDAFVNTIAYSDYADFRLLARLANGGSGTCVRAGTVRAVYDALLESTKLLGSLLTPPVEVPRPAGADYQVFLSHAARRVNASAGDLRVAGLKPEHDAALYRFRKLDRAEYDALAAPVEQAHEALYAFAKGQLAEGNLNTAKYALASTFDATLLGRHARALTNSQVAALALDLEAALFDPGERQAHDIGTEVPVNDRTPLVDLLDLLDRHKADWTLSLTHLKAHYQRRGVKRLQGARDDAGNLVEPWLKAEPAEPAEYARAGGFEANRTAATLNMLVPRRVKLVPRAGGAAIDSVAGVPLDRLATFNDYTVVGDGELNLPALKVKISSKKLYEALWKAGVLETEAGKPAAGFDADTPYILKFDGLPLVAPFEAGVHLGGVFAELLNLKVLTSLAAAHLKEESEDYTPAQIEELKKHYLTKSLSLSFPTTTPYTDLQQAIHEGSIDTRTGYRIELGDREILNLGKLHSANKFLDRMYEVLDGNGRLLAKPTFEAAADGDFTYRHKKLSARTKVTKVDELMRTLFDDFLGVKANGSAQAVLKAVGADDLAAVVAGRAKGKQPGRKEFVAALADARAKLERRSAELFRERLSQLVFYVGATGLLPDELDAKALSADEASAKYPDLALSKDEKEGTFFEVGDAILTVYAKTEYFSR